MKYTFKVSELSEVDNYRISRENPDAEFLFVTRKACTKGLESIPKQITLFIHKSFLQQFSKDDNQIVSNHPLCDEWGWRCQYHNAWYLPASEGSKAISELRQAKQFLKDKQPKQQKITITVSELNLDEKPKSQSEKIEAQVYNRALSADEIQKKYDEEKGFVFPLSLNGFRADCHNNILEMSYETDSSPDKVIINGVTYEKEIPF
jgi:hypothetical protein